MLAVRAEFRSQVLWFQFVSKPSPWPHVLLFLFVSNKKTTTNTYNTFSKQRSDARLSQSDFNKRVSNTCFETDFKHKDKKDFKKQNQDFLGSWIKAQRTQLNRLPVRGPGVGGGAWRWCSERAGPLLPSKSLAISPSVTTSTHHLRLPLAGGVAICSLAGRPPSCNADSHGTWSLG